jgi:hypothetical protein
MRRQGIGGELPRHILDLALLVRQVELSHGGALSTASRLGKPAR